MNSEQSDVDYRFTLIINRTSERSKNLASDSECESLNYAQQKVVVWQIVVATCKMQQNYQRKCPSAKNHNVKKFFEM